MPIEEHQKMLVMFVLGRAARDMILPLVVMNLRPSALLLKTCDKPPRHLDRPDTIRSEMTEEEWTVEALDLNWLSWEAARHWSCARTKLAVQGPMVANLDRLRRDMNVRRKRRR